MDGPDLTTTLRKSAEATAARILESARLDAEEVRADAARRIQRERAESMREEEEICRAAARSAIAAERHAAMRAVLLGRARLVDRVLELAAALLPAASRTEAYRSTIGEQLEGSMRFVADKGAVIRCSPELVPAMRAASKAHDSVTVQPDAETLDGFVVVTDDGSVTIDQRLSTQLRRMRPTLAIEIHDRLGRP